MPQQRPTYAVRVALEAVQVLRRCCIMLECSYKLGGVPSARRWRRAACSHEPDDTALPSTPHCGTGCSRAASARAAF